MNEFTVFFVSTLARILYIAILARVILSWFRVNPSNPIVAIIYQITEPILAPIRRVLPTLGMFDFSPVVALLVITLVEQAFISLAG